MDTKRMSLSAEQPCEMRTMFFSAWNKLLRLIATATLLTHLRIPCLHERRFGCASRR